MKGIIFTALEDAVCRRFGEAAWDTMLLATGVEGGFTSLAVYPDQQLYDLVTVAGTTLGLPRAGLLQELGRAAGRELAVQYPSFFEPHTRTVDFMHTLNEVVHREMRKSVADADPPRFAFDLRPDGTLQMDYFSRRGLCALAEGLTLGAADYYRESAVIRHEQCTHQGDPHCVLAMTFSAAVGAGAA